jgi:hypothetical protein
MGVSFELVRITAKLMLPRLWLDAQASEMNTSGPGAGERDSGLRGRFDLGKNPIAWYRRRKTE